MPLRTLRLSLTAWFTAATVVVALVMGAILFWAFHHELTDERQREMEETVSETIRGAGILAAEGEPLAAAAAKAAAEFRTPVRPVLVYGPGTKLLAGESAARADWIAQGAERAGTADGHFVAADGATWWAHAERYEIGTGESVVVLALQSGEPARRQYRLFGAALLTAALGAAIVAGLGGFLLSGLATAPVEASMTRSRQLVADLAHELRTPLSVMRAQVDVSLRREREGPEYAAVLHGLGREVERLSWITDDLLLLARGDAGQRSMAHDEVFLDEVASDALSAARSLAESRGVLLDMSRYEESRVVGDAELLRRLAMVLLDNAIQFTPRDRHVAVEVYPVAQEAVLRVTDEGEGIPPEAIERVFDRFFRLDPARGRTGGAGLGLSIARWIATEHGGSLSLQSTPGAGVVATFRMPLHL